MEILVHNSAQNYFKLDFDCANKFTFIMSAYNICTDIMTTRLTRPRGQSVKNQISFHDTPP